MYCVKAKWLQVADYFPITAHQGVLYYLYNSECGYHAARVSLCQCVFSLSYPLNLLSQSKYTEVFITLSINITFKLHLYNYTCITVPNKQES